MWPLECNQVFCKISPSHSLFDLMQHTFDCVSNINEANIINSMGIRLKKWPLEIIKVFSEFLQSDPTFRPDIPQFHTGLRGYQNRHSDQFSFASDLKYDL